jgi:hypothetical protein
MERHKMDKKVESIKGIIADRIENQRKAEINKVRQVFRDDLRQLKVLEKKEKALRKKIGKKLLPGYQLFWETIGVESHYYKDDLIPAVDRAVLERANELFSIGKKKEAQAELNRLIREYKIGK